MMNVIEICGIWAPAFASLMWCLTDIYPACSFWFILLHIRKSRNSVSCRILLLSYIRHLWSWRVSTFIVLISCISVSCFLRANKFCEQKHWISVTHYLVNPSAKLTKYIKSLVILEDKIIRQLDKIFFKFALICFVTSSQ